MVEKEWFLNVYIFCHSAYDKPLVTEQNCGKPSESRHKFHSIASISGMEVCQCCFNLFQETLARLLPHPFNHNV